MSAALPLRLEGELTIFRAAELKPVLLGDAPPTQVDLSAVSEIDTAGVQLLMVAKQAAQAQGRSLALINHSAAVIEVFELLNVTAFFGDPLVLDRPVKGS